eukprot:SAG22_NODE_1117_length_5518_cov_6.763610_2_plen_122_part_00
MQSDLSTARKYGFLYGGFAKNRIWWEAIIMLRKVLFLISACFMYKQEVSLKAGTAMVILVIFMNLHIAMKPYEADFAVVGLMEGMGMMVSAVVILVDMVIDTVMATKFSCREASQDTPSCC